MDSTYQKNIYQIVHKYHQISHKLTHLQMEERSCRPGTRSARRRRGRRHPRGRTPASGDRATNAERSYEPDRAADAD